MLRLFVLLSLLFQSFALADYPRPKEDKAVGKLEFTFKVGEIERRPVVRMNRLHCPAGRALVLEKDEALYVGQKGAEGFAQLTVERFKRNEKREPIIDGAGFVKERIEFSSYDEFAKDMAATIVSKESDPWSLDARGRVYKAGLQRTGSFRFNSHSYSLGNYVGLTPKDWVPGGRLETFGEDGKRIDVAGQEVRNAMEVFLDSYFERYITIHRHERTKEGKARVEGRGPVQVGDILVLTGNPAGLHADPNLREVTHYFSGRITRIDPMTRRYWITSKYQESSPLMEAPSFRWVELYETEPYNEMRFYRLRRDVQVPGQ